MPATRHIWLVLFILAAGSLTATALLAQTPPNCEVVQAKNPDRQVFECAGGLIIEAEAAAQIGFGDTGDTITVERGATLVEVTPGTERSQIRTPHAIAAVRGTIYLVDVTADSTAVFVVRGTVEVHHRKGSARHVVLGPGEGVDVSPGTRLTVKTWGASRVAALMARFGR